MRAVTVVVALEIEELHLQIGGRPKHGAVQAFAPYGADQSFNERLRERVDGEIPSLYSEQREKSAFL
jgi:hypothetical protein